MPVFVRNPVASHIWSTCCGLGRLSPRGYGKLVLITYCVAFALVVLGGVVRVTGSGLGCPDWPLCHGRLIPPFDFHTLIEYSHRLMAAGVSVLVLATSLVAWRSWRKQKGILITANLILVVLAIQVLLGAIAVFSELTPVIITAHLAAAEALVGMLALLYVIVRSHYIIEHVSAVPLRPDMGMMWLIGTTVLVVACVILSGAYVRGTGATFACSSWIVCVSGMGPFDSLFWINMVHRLMTLVCAGLVIASLMRVWHIRRGMPGGFFLVIVVAATFGLQVVVGTIGIYSTWVHLARVIHIALATAVWTGIVALAGLTWQSYMGKLRAK